MTTLGDGDPLSKPSTIGGERLALFSVDEVRDACRVKLDDELAGAVITGCEEHAVETQAREPHHCGSGNAGSPKERLRERPETRLAAFAFIHLGRPFLRMGSLQSPMIQGMLQ